MVLERIQKENDIQNIAKDELPVLAQEIREFLVEKISRTGGHLASNLGVVELTIAMHLCFHLPEDKMIWDVGHQSYTHKILTGRREGFDELKRPGACCSGAFFCRQPGDTVQFIQKIAGLFCAVSVYLTCKAGGNPV